MNFIKKSILVVFFILGVCQPAYAAQIKGDSIPSPMFLSAMQDIPLPPGLIELTAQTAVFDKAEGRIVESVAEMNGLSAEEVRQFYKATLPQLGWKARSPESFIRENEQLSLSFETLEGRHFTRFVLNPAK